MALTKREVVAAMAMQGLLSRQELYNEIPKVAISYADELLQLLNEPAEPPQVVNINTDGPTQ